MPPLDETGFCPPSGRGVGCEWCVGRQKIMLGDCLAVLRTMPPGKVDLVVTSPPYNIGVVTGVMKTGDRGMLISTGFLK